MIERPLRYRVPPEGHPLAYERRRNWQPPPLELDRLGAVVFTHDHLDHCGNLPG